jgi:hypothetical protein
LNFLSQNFYSWTLFFSGLKKTEFFSALKKTESRSRVCEDKEESWLLTGSSLDWKGRLSEEDFEKKYQAPCHQPQEGGEGGGGQQELLWKKLKAMRRKTVVEETFF